MMFKKFEMSEDMTNSLRVLFQHIEDNEGQLVVSQSSKGEWVIGYTFGREAEDSDMAGGAAYGVGPSLTSAIDQVMRDLRL